ncbi:MAG TPA: hypothetical protein VFC18_20525 [Burkholderiales bacterium]|nr:hypothetical protein [Burkholderiales bacterium]
MSLEERIAELSREIRAYPTPIARCDVQLGALLEERARLIALLERPACEPLELWVNDGGPSHR